MRILATTFLLSLMPFTVVAAGAPRPVDGNDPSGNVLRSPEEKDPLGNVVRSSAGERIQIPQERAYDPARPVPIPATSSSALPLTSALPGEEPYSLAFSRTWNFSVWGTSIGRTGMIPIDLDDDGRLEIVMGTSIGGGFSANGAWIVVRQVPGTGEYQIVHCSGPIAGNLSAVSAFRIGTKSHIFAGLGDGTLVVSDGASFAEETRVKPATIAISRILLADADNDGLQELVLVTSGAMLLLDPTTYVQKSRVTFSTTNFYGNVDAAVGNVDADPQNEIVLTTGKVLQFDGTNTTTDWDFSTFGTAQYVGLSDLDGDGMQEIVAARGWYYIDVYDADLMSPKFQIRTDLDHQALLLVDVTGDGTDEILYGDGQWGEIHAISASTRTEIWNIPNPEHGTTRIAVADTDDDGQLEVMWGAGWTSTGPDYLFVHGLPSRAREFQSDDVVGPFAAVAQGDVDNDGREDIVAISWESESGYADGVLFVFDAETYALKWKSSTSLFQRYAWTGVHDVAIGDVDGDGDNEIVVGTDRLYDGAIYVIDGRTHAIQARYYYDSGSPISAIALADFDHDGRVDILAGDVSAHSGSPGIFLYLIDASTGAVKWKSTAFPGYGVYAIEIADVTGDGVSDAIVSANQIAIVNGATRTLRLSTAAENYGLDVADLDGDGTREIWVGTRAGDLARIDPVALARTTVAHLCSTGVNSVRVGRASTLQGSVQFACEGDIGIYGAAENKVLWRSPAVGAYAAYYNNLIAADRGQRALLIAGTGTGVVAYQGYGTSNPDVDGDGVPNHLDNCPEVANADQADRDGDHVGDACNGANDRDGDEWADRLDNCPAVANPSQADTDHDSVGDACNDAQDRDGDEWADALDNCPDRFNDQQDRDGDHVGDLCDPYPDNPDNYRARCEEAIDNEKRFGDALLLCEAERKFSDDDGDGEDDATDACPGTPASASVDSAGCALQQFCASIDIRTAGGPAICVNADWKNDEPLGNAGDCKVLRALCVPRDGARVPGGAVPQPGLP